MISAPVSASTTFTVGLPFLAASAAVDKHRRQLQLLDAGEIDGLVRCVEHPVAIAGDRIVSQHASGGAGGVQHQDIGAGAGGRRQMAIDEIDGKDAGNDVELIRSLRAVELHVFHRAVEVGDLKIDRRCEARADGNLAGVDEVVHRDVAAGIADGKSIGAVAADDCHRGPDDERSPLPMMKLSLPPWPNRM